MYGVEVWSMRRYDEAVLSVDVSKEPFILISKEADRNNFSFLKTELPKLIYQRNNTI